MKSNLHIIVSCTDRKRAAVSDELHLRSIPVKPVEDRAKAWWLRLARHQGQAIPAIDLYAGGHWSIVRALPESARQTNLNAKLWVISAGYGLVSSSACLHPYSATFAGTHPDTVTTSEINGSSRKELLQKWWDTLSKFPGPSLGEPRSVAELAQKSRNAYFLIIASPDYLSALEQDLSSATEYIRDRNNLIIVTAPSAKVSESLNANLIPSSARLQSRVGGTRGSLHARVALMILKNVESWGFGAEVLRDRINSLVAQSPELLKYERKRITDKEVSDFIRASLKQSPQASCTSLLRSLRDRELACEQSRFKDLYWGIKEAGR